MELKSLNRSILRASAAYRRATNALEAATTPKARQRHLRRQMNARRAIAEAERVFADIAFTEA